MSYTTNLSEEYVERDYFVRLSPRRRVAHTSFTVFSGSVYQATFTHGQVASVSVNGTALSAGSSTSLSAGQWFFESNVLYIRKSDSTAPGSSDHVIVTYYMFLSTGEYDWHETPTDSATTIRHWEPYVISAPDTKQSLSDLLFGFQPVSSSNMTADNSEHFWEPHINDSSFNQAQIKVWHKVGDLSTANISLIFSGFCSDVSYKTNKITIQILDDKDQFSQEFRVNLSGSSDFYNTTEFPNCDPLYIGKPKRRIWGVVEGVKVVNLNYSETTAIGNNNKFGLSIEMATVTSGSGSGPSYDMPTFGTPPPGYSTLDPGAANTTTRIYFTSYVPFESGEIFWYDNDIGGPGGDYRKVTAVGANYVDFTPAAPGVPVTWTLRKNPCSYIYIEQDTTRYKAEIGRDFTLAIEGGTLVANFNASYQANLGMANPIRHYDVLYVERVWGKLLTEQFSGSYVGSYDNPYFVLTNGPAILYEILKANLGLAESEIDGSSFSSLTSTITEKLGIVVPQNIGDEYPTFQDLITRVCQSIRTRLYRDNSGKWTLRQIAVMGAYDKQADGEEIKDGLEFKYGYQELLSDIFVEYKYQEHSLAAFINEPNPSTVSSESLNAKYLHGVKKQKTFQTYHYQTSGAQAAADDYAAIYGERQGRIYVDVDKRFFDSEIGDVIQLSREDMPGFSTVEGTEQTKKAVIIESVKNLNNVRLTLDDQKGLEDN